MITKFASLLGIIGILSFFFFDQKIANAILALEIQTTPSLRYVATLFSPAFHIFGSVVIAIIGYYYFFPYRQPLYIYALAQVLSGTFIQITKNIIGRARPLIAGNLNPYVILPINFAEEYHSFPSGHACVCAALGTILYFSFPKLKIAILALTILAPFVRILQMKHFMSDILMGLSAGFFLTQATITLFFQYIEKKIPL